ncbi:MAG TPA: hypothetical protein VL993_05915 [Stellaceae bacterium]|nr:hypothetical protein [Stellaceae bacterium]
MTASAVAVTSPAAAAAAPPSHPTAWHNGSSFGFRDLIDIVNPLQHIPIIGSIYRWATGDRPGEAAQIAGDALYGGPIGVGAGLVSAMFEDSSGRDLGERAMVAMFGPGKDGPAVASAPAASPATTVAQTAGSAPAATAAPAANQLFGGIAQPPPTRAALAALAVPDHAPMSLYSSPAPAGQSAVPASVQNPAARALIARAIPLQRAVPASPRSGAGVNAPVPLEIPPGALPAGSVPSGRLPMLQSTTPLDISQKMMDGLDKYMKLEEQLKKEGTTPAPVPGPAPGAPPTPGVDLSL